MQWLGGLLAVIVSMGTAWADQPLPPSAAIGETIHTLAAPRVMVQISTYGAAVKSAMLRDDQFDQEDRDPPAVLPAPPAAKLKAGPMDLVKSWDAPYYPFFVHFTDLRGAPEITRVLKSDPSRAARTGGFWNLYQQDPVFTLVASDETSVTMVWPDPVNDRSTLFIERTYRVAGDYLLEANTRLVNLGSGDIVGRLRLVMTTFDPLFRESSGGCGSGMFSAPPDVKQVVCHSSGKLESLNQKDVIAAGETDAAKGKGGSAEFTGLNSRYFLIAAVPQGDQPVQCLAAADSVGSLAAIAQWDAFLLKPALDSCVPAWLMGTPNGEGHMACAVAEAILKLSSNYDLSSLMTAYSAALATASTPEAKTNIEAAKTALVAKRQKDFPVQAYLGPKDIDQLKAVNVGLEDTIDFWILGFLCKPMLWLMRLSYSVIPSWGVAIVFLTLIVKLLTLYWTQKSFVQMRRMAQLKPKMNELNAKFKDDKAKLNTAMMELYKREKVNPLGGCLPMLLQMPIWIALYRTIYSAVELFQAPLFLWITDLSAHDPYFVMPLVLGVLMFIQQKMSPTAGDPAQAKMMLYMMPIMFTVFMLFLPSGLVFYILVNTLLSIGHQKYMNRNL